MRTHGTNDVHRHGSGFGGAGLGGLGLGNSKAPGAATLAPFGSVTTRSLDLLSVNGASRRAAPRPPKTRPYLVTAVLLLTDVLTVSLAAALAVVLRWSIDHELSLLEYAKLWPLVSLFIVGNALAGLYPNLPFAPAEELRRLTLVTTLICLVLGMLTFMFKEGESFSRGALLLGFGLLCVVVPLGRAVARYLLSHMSWWGYSVVVLGSGATATRIVRHLKRHPQAGLTPVGVLTDDQRPRSKLGGVPVMGRLDDYRKVSEKHGVSYAVIALCDIPPTRVRGLLDRLDDAFRHMLIIPDAFDCSTLWVDSIDVGGTLGLQVQHRLTDPYRRMIKRGLDLTLVMLFSPVWLVAFAVLALMVKLSSPGPMLYSQIRVGRNGRLFRAYKFRSMRVDADDTLHRHLANDPAARAEWARCQKLTNDPRVTRLGRWMRRTSLDELPQVINVIRDEMSLVGPRPVLEDELDRYGEAQDIVLKAKPGISGLWQVSGRNKLTYDERVAYDVYYVRNWSVWLDLYVLARTIIPVLKGDGAV